MCPAGVFPVGSSGLLKLSQPGRNWQAGKYWMVPEVERYWGIFCRKNNGREAVAILDSSYIKCYNKCNDDNKNVICHQSPKFALYGVFAFRDIKSRRTPKNAVQRIYINFGNTKQPELYAVQGQQEKAYLYI